MKNIFISNREEFERIKINLARDGSRKLHILADFDKTLTQAFVDSKSIPSLISILRDGNYLTKDYTQKAHALYEKYHPIEVNPKISLEEKKKAMYEWWRTHFDLLIQSKLNKKDLKKIVNSGKIKLRQGIAEFLGLLYKNNIPLVILSSSGLGEDSISMFLKSNNMFYDNIHIICNRYKWDNDDYAISIRGPIIHSMNKDETSIKDFTKIYGLIKNRKNVILLGDNLEDIGMVAGFKYNNLLKIAFLNEDVEKNLPYYKKNYDILILNDSDMSYVNKLLNEIVKS